MGEQIHTHLSRVTFEKGWLTDDPAGDPEDGSVECGDGTAFPMEVTVDQLAEIVYRVRECVFESGSYTTPVDSENNEEIAVITAPSEEDLATDAGGTLIVRGYLAEDDAVVGVEGSTLGDIYTVDSIDYREYLNERSMWQGLPMPNYIFSSFWAPPNPIGFRCFGFSFAEILGANPSFGIYMPLWDFSEGFAVELNAFCASNLHVAFIGEGLLAPDTKLYLNIEFFFSWNNGFFGDYVSTNRRAIYETTPEEAVTYCNFILKLSDGEQCACPLYFPGEGIEYNDVVDFVLKATKWWPYADAAGNLIWDENTGLKL